MNSSNKEVSKGVRKNRLKSIDILKTLGLLGIIIAHVNPPSFLVQLRGFDVILLVSASVYLYFLSNRKEKYISYVWKRIKRLVFPTYVFLFIFFLGAFFVRPYPFSFSQILDSFLLRGGIGYVWIVRIYLIVALLLPLVKRFTSRIKTPLIFLMSFVALVVLQELLFKMGVYELNFIFKDIVAYAIPCCAIIFLMLWVEKVSGKKVTIMAVIMTFLYLGLAIYYALRTGNYVPTQTMKYPFRIYYMVYALAISGWLMIIFKNKKISEIIWNKCVGFMSEHSFWIYLWHIPFVFLVENCFSGVFWLAKLLIVLVCALVITYVQNKIADDIDKKMGHKSEFVKIFRG